MIRIGVKMANTTDMIITCFGEDRIVKEISEKTGLDFLKISDGNKCGGPKFLSLESYGACYRSIGKEKIDQIIKLFIKSDWTFPELAVLIIDDDNDTFNGVVTIDQS